MLDDKESLNCIVSDSVRLKALKTGPLTGYSFVVKDNIAISGYTSSFGHARWRETHPKSAFTAPVVTRMLEAGADMIGLAKLDQLTYSVIGNVGEGEHPVNPLYPDRFTGGSSSGVASAVAGGVADIGIGTDTGGSIRVPAAACGLFSIRPTHGRIDSSDVIPLAQSFDVIGLLVRNPNLLLKAFNVVDSKTKTDTHEIKSIILPSDCLKSVSEGVRDAILDGAQKIAKLIGAELEEGRFERFADSKVVDLFARLQGREIWANHSKWVKENISFLAPDVRLRLERAETFSKHTSEEQQADQQALNTYREQYSKFVESGSVVILPIMPDLPPKTTASAEELLKFRTETVRLIAPSSLTGCPEVVIPIKSSATGFTYGLGILASKEEDTSLLNSITHVFHNRTVLDV